MGICKSPIVPITGIVLIIGIVTALCTKSK